MPDAKEPPRDPSNVFLVGGRLGRDGKRYGGRLVDRTGKVFREFADDEVNTGQDPAAPTAPAPAPAPAPTATAPTPAPAAPAPTPTPTATAAPAAPRPGV
jgi:pyruvate/2-oxoglutarate dehydrogenase complex dihydrolipoamide acyltransferase (E2) component